MTSGPTTTPEERPDAAAPNAAAANAASRDPATGGSASHEAADATRRSRRKASSAADTPSKSRPRRRDGSVVGYLSGLFTFLTLVVLALGGVVYWGKATFDTRGPLAQDTTVTIARNQGVTEIADSLSRAGVIDQPTLFKVGVAAYGAKDRMRYGEYAFPAGVSMREAMEIIVSGKSIEHAVTIPEGLTSLQVVERLRDQPLLTGDVKQAPAEGAILPETYRFMRGTPREQILARMKEHREEAVAKIWRERDPGSPLKSAEELVILASLVEKETGVAEERARVAAVFVNRLQKGMRLQSDPTIVYGLVGGRGTLGRSLTRSDIASRTPYNTYVVPGLPAGPIANPGRDSLEAAARPAKTRDLYFVADGSGGHAFAGTLADHNRNVANWRRIEKARGVPADRLAPDEQTPEASSDAPASTAAPTSSTPARTPPAGQRPRPSADAGGAQQP